MRCGVRTVGIQHKTRGRAQVFSVVDAVAHCLGMSWSHGCLVGVLYALQWVAKVGKGQRNWRQVVCSRRTNDILQYSKRESFSFGGVSSNRHVWEAEREVGKAAARDSEIRSQSAVGGCLIHRAQVNGVVMKPKPSDLAEKEPSLSGSLEPGARRGALFPP